MQDLHQVALGGIEIGVGQSELTGAGESTEKQIVDSRVGETIVGGIASDVPICSARGSPRDTGKGNAVQEDAGTGVSEVDRLEQYSVIADQGGIVPSCVVLHGDRSNRGGELSKPGGTESKEGEEDFSGHWGTGSLLQE